MWIALDTLWWHNVVLAAHPDWTSSDTYEVVVSLLREVTI